MVEEPGNLWDHYGRGETVAITANGMVNRHGLAVMGRGLEWEAASRFPDLPRRLGQRIRESGNHLYYFPDLRLFTFPVKHYFKAPADLSLIRRSALSLVEAVDQLKIPRVYLTRPGCGHGKRRWSEVQLILKPILDDRFISVSPDYAP